MYSIQVSVVIAAKNECLHLKEALLSVLAQEKIDLELIFIDDNSTDETFAIATKIAATDNRLVVHKNPKSGKCNAFNYGTSLAKGKFVCIFAGDDIMPPGSLLTRWQAVKDLPTHLPAVGLSKLITMSETPRFDGHLVPKRAGRGALSGVSPLMNKLALNYMFPVPEDLPNEDTWMELAVMYLDGWQIVHSDVICCRWRVHSGNSINLSLPFDEFNRRITIRMSALEKFRNKFSGELSTHGKRDLDARIACEKQRASGSMLGILVSKVSIIDKLRAISQCNSAMYTLRGRLYGLLSGW